MKLNKRQSYLLTKILSKEWKDVSWSIFSLTMKENKKGNFSKDWKEENTKIQDIEYMINECCKIDDYNQKYFDKVKAEIKTEQDEEYHQIMCDRSE